MPATIYTILRSNAVQNYITHKAASYLSSQLHTKVQIGGIDIGFFFQIILEDINIEDKHNNSMIKSDKIAVSFRLKTKFIE